MTDTSISLWVETGLETLLVREEKTKTVRAVLDWVVQVRHGRAGPADVEKAWER